MALVLAHTPLANRPLQACINDRDTLAEEVRNMNSKEGDYDFVVRAVSGRFERNPPLYYEMRLQRVAREVQAQPGKLDLYDDAAVACDRLGRSGEAITWIEKKRAQLQRANGQTAQTREHWYRYYANAGTFWAHRWIRNKAQRGRISEMKTARALIRKAIALKPDAHFGREKYQLKAMEWIIKPPAATKNAPLPDLLNLTEYSDWLGHDVLKEIGHPDAIKGLSGLIVLGNAWESVDVYHSLAKVLNIDNKSSLAFMAQLRARELADTGHYSLYPGAPTGTQLVNAIQVVHDTGPDPKLQLEETFSRLRLEADEYHKRRTTYMLTRLQQGQHPDTHASFWSEWHDDGPPPLQPEKGHEKLLAQLAALGVLAAGSLFCLALLRSARQRRPAAI
jgi:hypothetical protein